MKKRKQVIQEYRQLQSNRASKGEALRKVTLSSGFAGSTIRQGEGLIDAEGKRISVELAARGLYQISHE